MAYSVIIPSASIFNVRECWYAITKQHPNARVIVVSDGIAKEDQFGKVTWVEGVQPFCYSRNINLGIQAAGEDDVILCNDDALLQTPGGFDLLQNASSHFGVVSPKILGRCANPRQVNAAPGNVTEATALAFVCVYIPRSTIDKVGLLDERFVGGMFEDDDYCRRVLDAGLSLGICGDCVMKHDNRFSSFVKKPNYGVLLDENRVRFEQKWVRTKTLLSICICSIYSRKAYLDRLLAVLSPQLCDRVELLISIDAGQVSIGEKRQRLLNQAGGEFIVYIDDDDLIAPDYVRQILTAIHRNPKADAITYRSKRYHDGVFEADCIYSLANEDNSSKVVIDGFPTYLRWPYHITPLRRELALKVGFPTIDWREDTVFAEKLHDLLKSEEHIREFLYFYYWRSNRNGEQTHKALQQ